MTGKPLVTLFLLLFTSTVVTGDVQFSESCQPMKNVQFYGTLVDKNRSCISIPVVDYEVNFSTTIHEADHDEILGISIHYCGSKTTHDNEIEMPYNDHFRINFHDAYEEGKCKTADVKNVRMYLKRESRGTGTIKFMVHNNIFPFKQRSFWKQYKTTIITLATILVVALFLMGYFFIYRRRHYRTVHFTNETQMRTFHPNHNFGFEAY